MSYFSPYLNCKRINFVGVYLFLVYALFMQLEVIASEQKLVIAMFDFPPYEYKKGDRIDGISVRIVKAVFKKIDQPIELIELPWSRALLYLKENKIDGLFEVLWKKERTRYAEYCKEILMNETASLFTKSMVNIPYTGNLVEITPYVIGVRQDFSYGFKFDELREKGKFKKLVSNVDSEHLLRMLNQNYIDIVIGDKYGLPYVFKKIKDIKKLDPIKRLSPDIESTPSYLVFSKYLLGSGIAEQFDAALKLIKNNGEYQAIINQWENQNIILE
ncbi:substrate-binding periplasmic protein [Pseudoalteromonas denitrificans]|uniref:Amino acid ABC transporter substrate-binding protein, PAAT family n=1 Tax=Pseudoalteromonas denitrificans DSM 6059 TaxID=1123010 RepID=A0A1I1PTM4_9GAMM|nr:transporter substrate-binding domain-containing protein [Pseudoalteromonas denitrificans]SFD10958.1 amino acid ABC transporter substrate-binding protein, PAAT family [Pseudoalteromonas denitrificans DSM 6059]